MSDVISLESSCDSDSSNGSMPALLQRKRGEDDTSSSSDDDDSSTYNISDLPPHDNGNDASDSSENQEPPGLLHPINLNSSNVDDSLSEAIMPTAAKTTRDRAPRVSTNAEAPVNRSQTQQRGRDDAPHLGKLDKEKMRKRLAGSKITAIMRGASARNRWRRLRARILRIQALWRGYQTRTIGPSIVHRLEEFRRFYKVWGNCMILAQQIVPELPDWASLRDKQAYIQRQDLIDDYEKDRDRKETDKKLTSSMEDAMKVMDERAADQDDDIEEVEGLPLVRSRISAGSSSSSPDDVTQSFGFKNIRLSGDVVKWRKNGDPKYVEFFVRRMKQLLSGERSRILAKRLKGTTTAKTPIYETYLEQKSGFRILWTEEGDTLMIWYVAKHQRVSRLMRLIDDSKNRSERQRVSVREIDEMKTDDTIESATGKEYEIFLDPLGNVPLKVYDVRTDEIEEIQKQNWTPALHLTEEERQVVESEGTVLLLGRSGTGKTICICNRMEFDRQRNARDPLFSQLFIARSPRLCAYVKNNIGDRKGSKFVTFEKLLLELERILPKVDGIRDSFPDNLMMKFSTFKRDIYDGDKGVDALIVWTNIRSFLKGSIEALQSSSISKNFFVSEEDFLSERHFGKKRCRLSTEQRKIVYQVFLTYKEELSRTNAWDNCDRIIALIQRLLAAERSNPDLFKGLKSWCKWSKIYVDEVQDYTQSEILLFFRLSGAGDLFLAGDPAQNVTKGVEFRFDDIRSVGYHIAGKNRELIPQKPKIVNVNFRSHAGILNAAAAILSQMFAYFPDSAKQLGRDNGLFKGPRPGIFHKVKPETMAELLSEKMSGTVVLTHDDCVRKVADKLGGYTLVYGIRRAKGLEFKSVVIVDFFSSLPERSQKPWRELLLDRDMHDFKSRYPEVEGQLKLLYTGVTRCIDRLFFAETSSSMSGEAFLRFMTDTASVKKDRKKLPSIATKSKIENIDNLTMTQDEWLASGIANAEAAEAEISSDNQHAQSLMEKAVYCFKQADNEAFEEKARIQAKSFALRYTLFNADRLSRDTTSLDTNAKSSRSKIEQAGAKILETLLKENLLAEARGLGKDMAKILRKEYPSSDHLNAHIIQLLPAGHGYKDMN